ncbi:hypothetical protein THAOC_02920 [Thalassiosira oceanica]|uniref:Uncharacterized protein n=1 Tax=Thalassiosira oceanica TaxID=159749 RepID=K0TDY1_THAOC|nr:hypothetical protein THAOC_02920 [Thalassiosira oceanica]|eukprot:EJK75359.1 hypothetical protein THAOC_02920 [Thalassiosira oceanica]
MANSQGFCCTSQWNCGREPPHRDSQLPTNPCSGQRNRPSGREPPRRDSQPTPAPVKGTVLVDVNLLAETPNRPELRPKDQKLWFGWLGPFLPFGIQEKQMTLVKSLC